MKILIIEDEQPAFRRISKLILELQPDAEILGHADSIQSALQLFNDFPNADLVLMDIELADGQSFEIFKQTSVNCPVIFTTAYDEFALQAFKVNSIDYLLKPIHPDELRKALDKFKFLQKGSAPVNMDLLLQALRAGDVPRYKERFLLKLGQKYVSVPVEEIAYFQAMDKLVYLITHKQRKYVSDHSLDELSKMLPPKSFFHLNRQFLAAFTAIDSVNASYNGKLKVQLIPPCNEEVWVSKEKAPDFKEWLNR